MLAVPVIAYLILTSADGSSWLALAVFAAAAFTDFLDGFLARRTGTVSELGKVIDPLVDRIFISSIVLALAWRGLLPVVGVALIVSRDILAIIGYKLLEGRGIRLRVSLLGKAYTAVLMAALVAAMAGVTIGDGAAQLGFWLFWAGVAGSLTSGALYAYKAVSLLANK